MKVVRRHKPEGGYPRGEETRARIVGIALGLFGEKGFDGVSTREIASQAGVPPPSLQYYFENKQGLYLACIEHIQATALDAVAPTLDAANALLDTNATADRLIEAYCTLLECLTEFLLGTPEAASRALFIARRDMPWEAAMKQIDMQNMASRRLQACFIELATRIADDRVTENEARLIATTINGQLLGIYLTRNIKALTGWDEVTPPRLLTLKQIIRKQTTMILKAYQKNAI